MRSKGDRGGGQLVRTAFDEMNGFGGEVRAPYRAFVEWLGVQHMNTLS